MPETTAETVEGQVAEQQERLRRFAREGADAVNTAKTRVTETLHDVAGAVRASASQVTGNRSARELADEAYNGLSETAEYVTETDPRDMWRDFTKLVRSQPAAALAAAAVLGFLMGRSARRG